MKEVIEASKRGPRPFYGGYNRNRQRQDQGKQQQEKQDKQSADETAKKSGN